MKIRFLKPYDQIGFNIKTPDPDYHIGITRKIDEPQGPATFAIVAIRLDSQVPLQLVHWLSEDFKTNDEAKGAWTTGFEIGGLADRSEVSAILRHLLETNQALEVN